MASNDAKFEDLGNEKAYFKSNQAAVDLLSSITAVDKALSVPYVKLWEINPDGKPVRDDGHGNPKGPISLKLVEPPSFGAPIDDRFFMDRPPVSLDRISVKTQQSYGIQMFRDVTLSFVVHRPDVVFDEKNPDFDNWSSLISPGSMHALVYGWIGSSANDIINGQGLHEPEQGNEVDGRRTVLFTVTNYNFTINPDGSITVNINGQENGDHVLNRLTVSDDKSPVSAGVQDTTTPTGQVLLKKIQDDFHKLKQVKNGKLGYSIELGEILDNIIAKTLSDALKRAGYGNVSFKIGKFNDKAGSAKKNYGGTMAGNSIKKFQIPAATVKDAMATFKQLGTQFTVRNVLEYFISQIHDKNNWADGPTEADHEQAKKDANNMPGKATPANVKAALAKIVGAHIAPDIRMKTVSKKNGPNIDVLLYIVDLKSEVVQFNDQAKLRTNAPRDEIRKVLKDNSVPYISFRSGLSFIQDAHFEVQQDPNMKAIMIQTYFSHTSRPDVAEYSAASRREGSADPKQLIFSSAIEGTITMIGNFVFDAFALVWLDFGVYQWSGTFHVMEKEDSLTRGEFTSTFRFRATGDDPLNTQGRPTQEELNMSQQAEPQKPKKKKGKKKKDAPAPDSTTTTPNSR